MYVNEQVKKNMDIYVNTFMSMFVYTFVYKSKYIFNLNMNDR